MPPTHSFHLVWSAYCFLPFYGLLSLRWVFGQTLQIRSPYSPIPRKCWPIFTPDSILTEKKLRLTWQRKHAGNVSVADGNKMLIPEVHFLCLHGKVRVLFFPVELSSHVCAYHYMYGHAPCAWMQWMIHSPSCSQLSYTAKLLVLWSTVIGLNLHRSFLAFHFFFPSVGT